MKTLLYLLLAIQLIRSLLWNMPKLSSLVSNGSLVSSLFLILLAITYLLPFLGLYLGKRWAYYFFLITLSLGSVGSIALIALTKRASIASIFLNLVTLLLLIGLRKDYLHKKRALS